MAAAMYAKCSANLQAISSYTGSARASSIEISSMDRQKKPIQPVPSDCSSTPSTGSLERSKGPMLSSPRNPPSKMLFSSASFRLTQKVK